VTTDAEPSGTDDAPEAGLNRLEVVLAAIHASALSTVLGVAALLLMGAHSIQGFVHPSFAGTPGLAARSLMGGLYAGVFIFLLAIAGRRVPRTELAPRDVHLCAVSGFVAGFVGAPLVYFLLTL
jgi:hypothetical protein